MKNNEEKTKNHEENSDSSSDEESNSSVHDDWDNEHTKKTNITANKKNAEVKSTD